MALSNIPDVIQKKINEQFNGLEYVRTYIDDLFIVSKKSYEDHINKLDNMLRKLTQKNLTQMQKSSFSPEMNQNTQGFG